MQISFFSVKCYWDTTFHLSSEFRYQCFRTNSVLEIYSIQRDMYRKKYLILLNFYNQINKSDHFKQTPINLNDN